MNIISFAFVESFGNVTKQLKEKKEKLRKVEEVAIRGYSGGGVEIKEGNKRATGERRKDVEAEV